MKALCSPRLPLHIQSPQLAAPAQDELCTQSYLQNLLGVRKKRAYLHINETGESPQKMAGVPRGKMLMEISFPVLQRPREPSACPTLSSPGQGYSPGKWHESTGSLQSRRMGQLYSGTGMCTENTAEPWCWDWHVSVGIAQGRACTKKCLIPVWASQFLLLGS